MATRHLKQWEVTLLESSSGGEEEEEDGGTQRSSAFAMMIESSSSSSSSGEDEDAAAEAVHSASGQQRSRKSKPLSRAQRAAAAAVDDELALREALVSVARSAPAVAASNGSGASTALHDLLALHAPHLIEENEMRRKFGAAAVNEAQVAEEGGSGRKKRRGKPNLRAQRRVGKKRVLVAAHRDWPMPPSRVGGGIGMALDRGAAEADRWEEGARRFAYDFSDDYAALQADYLARVSTNDPNAIRELLHHHPYHVDSLLQLSVVSDSYGQRDTSAELLRRCLFVLESAWHPAFLPLERDCRLLYANRPNRALFTALFLHMSAVGRKGCSRTALELGKFLLRLDPAHDPKGVLLCIDHYALKARADGHPFLERLLDSTQGALTVGGVALGLLPNLLFSRALSRHLRELVGASGGNAGREGGSAVAPSGADASSADAALRDALLTFPDVLLPLVTACDAAAGSEEVRWRSLLRAEPFASFAPLGSPGGRGGEMLVRIVQIYLVRSTALWKVRARVSLFPRLLRCVFASVLCNLSCTTLPR